MKDRTNAERQRRYVARLKAAAAQAQAQRPEPRPIAVELARELKQYRAELKWNVGENLRLRAQLTRAEQALTALEAVLNSIKDKFDKIDIALAGQRKPQKTRKGEPPKPRSEVTKRRKRVRN